MHKLLIGVLFCAAASAGIAQSIDFPELGCKITLPSSNKWIVQRSGAAKYATPIRTARSEDNKIVGTLVVHNTFPQTARQREDYFTAVRSTLERSGWTVLRETDAPVAGRGGRYISARSRHEGVVQLTYHLFVNKRTFVISSTIIADTITTELKERGSQFFGGFRFRPPEGNP
jgi:hypothetical protein